MTSVLINRTMIMPYNLRQPPEVLVLHSDIGSQHKPYRELLDGYTCYRQSRMLALTGMISSSNISLVD